MTDKHFITVMEGMYGFFGVHVWLNEEEEDMGPFWEPYERSFRTHPTREEAEVEAIEWAKNMDMEYRA